MKKNLMKALALTLAMTMLSPALTYADGETELAAETEAPVESEVIPSEEVPAATETEKQTEKETEKVTETETEKVTEAETEKETEKVTEKETEKVTEKETEKVTEKETEKPTKEDKPVKETEKESVKETEKESVKESEKTEETKKPEKEVSPEQNMDRNQMTDQDTYDYNSAITNEDLIKNQHIVYPDLNALSSSIITTTVTSGYRFVKDENAKPAILQGATDVYEMRDKASRVVGTAPESDMGTLVYILKDTGEGWYYIESEEVRGFVDFCYISYPDEEISEEAMEADYAKMICQLDPMENDALTYLMTTAYDPVIEKDFAIATDYVEIYDNPSLDPVYGNIVGSMTARSLAYVIVAGNNEEVNDWIYIESGDVRGFADPDLFILGEDAARYIEVMPEENLLIAEEIMAPGENAALHYSLKSVKTADEVTTVTTSAVDFRQSMVDFALQFVGYPYVWGGTSLTNGCDCSGFVMQIYSYFGYSIPRTSAVQSTFGMQIPIEAALPGDLIFYAKEGHVYHVSMYIGNGRVVHASTPTAGIITSGISENAVWATRVIR